nr:MAG TPA: hypothetical protein [Bacteriophage sp.]
MMALPLHFSDAFKRPFFCMIKTERRWGDV